MKLIAIIIIAGALLNHLLQAQEGIACKRVNELLPSIIANVELAVVSKGEAADRIRQKSTALGFTPDEIEKHVEERAFAHAVVTIYRSSIKAANMDKFAFVIFDEADQVIARIPGKFDVPETPSASDRRWWNIEVVKFEDFERSIKFRVVDLLQNSFEDFLIFKPAAMREAGKPKKERPADFAVTEKAAQRLAVERFPELGVAGSAINREFVAVHEQLRKNDPAFFENPQWPWLLAEQCSRVLKKH